MMGVLADAPQVIDANVATAADPGGQRALWQYREGHTEAVNAAGVPVKLDVAVPRRRARRGSSRPLPAW